ncbi:MAG: type I 3-dehydroquinate dehydratase, partial [Planctomycetota bacterium]
MTKIVTSLLPTDVDQGLELARRAQRAGTDMVEFRLDHFRDADAVTALVRQSAAPVLASCRVEEEGGLFRGSFDRRRELLVAAAAGGVEWLDVEHWEQLSLPPGVRTRILRSYHRMQDAPRDLPAIVERMSRSGADALKVTTMGYDAADVDILNGLYERPGSVPLVAFAAGSACVASRFLALLQGAPFLYCSLGPGQGTAPGQPDLFDALELYHARGLGPESCFWGLLGSPVDHSLGYRLHNGLGRWLRDVPVYLPFDTEQPERLLKNLLS